MTVPLPPTVSLPMAARVVIAATGFSHIRIHNTGESTYVRILCAYVRILCAEDLSEFSQSICPHIGQL